MIEHRACPACGDSTDGSREIKRTFAHHRDQPPLPIRIVECGCGHVFLTALPPKHEFSTVAVFSRKILAVSEC
jgi:hypothetical protein